MVKRNEWEIRDAFKEGWTYLSSEYAGTRDL